MKGDNGMKKSEKKGGTYATNKAGYIKAPRNPSSGDPKVTRTSGNDLRVKNGKK